MRQIKLNKLSLVNFKGVKEFTLEANGDNIRVYGDNETGKTTVFDGFVWLLFDKNSENKKDFAVKTLDQDNKEIHGLNHEVEGVFQIDGQPLSLRKVFSEKWTKKRGSITKEFSGHTTDYYINGVPSKKKEYLDKVSEVVSEDVFKLLTSPSYFNEQMHWKERRKILLEVCGDITTEEVIAGNEDLEKLMGVLNGRSIEDHRKVIAAKRREINDELDRLPVRIDEITRGLPDIQNLNKEKLEAELEEFNKQLEAKQDQINDIRNGSEVGKKRKAISDIDLELANIKNEHSQNGQQEVYSVKTRIQEEESNESILQSKVKNLQQRKQMNEESTKESNAERARLRKEWEQENAQEFKHEEACECPTCGQDLPEEQVEAAREKALKEFNQLKSRKLEAIKSRGISAKEKTEKLQQENEKIDKEIADLESQINTKQNSLTKLKDKLASLESNVTDVTENPIYLAKVKEKQKLENEIDQLQQSVESSVSVVKDEVAAIKEKQRNVQLDLSRIIQASSSQKRIEELQEQEKELAAEFEQLEQELYLTEEFTRTKVNMLEQKINTKFKHARFKLFKENLNGGLEETCETLFKGVPYSSGLNNAARINVGLDIINTLNEFYGVSAPIFVDNSEAVTKLIDIDTQVISLVVSEPDKELRVETNKNDIQEAI